MNMDTMSEYVKKILIDPRLTIKKAIEYLNKTAAQILIAVGKEGIIKGVITDGDIRRAILKGISLDSPVEKIMNRNPKYVMEGEYTTDEVVEMFKKYGIKRIPVVDKDKRVVDVLFIEDFIQVERKEKENHVIIMAGGKGTRLLPLTKILPKPLMPVGDKTFIELIMENFHKQGFSKFVIVVNYKKEIIKSYLKERNLPYEITFVDEEKPLGTAGGLRLVYEAVDLKDPVILTNCDILIEVDYEKVLKYHVEKNADMTLIAKLENIDVPYGVVEVDGAELVRITEKPSVDILINTGIYVFNKKLFQLIEKDTYLDMNDYIYKLKENGYKIVVFPYHGKYVDIGEWKGYREFLKVI